MIIEAVRDFSQRELAPKALELDRGESGVRESVWRQCVELDLDRALLPQERDGIGLDEKAFLGLITEVAAGEAGTAVLLLIHNVAVSIACEDDRGDIEGRWTVDTASGPSGDFVLAAAGAEGVVRFDGSGTVSIQRLGGSERSIDDQLGLRSAQAAAIDYSALEQGHISEENAGLTSRCHKMVWLGVAAVANGIARRAHRLAQDYAHERYQGGTQIEEHDAVRLMLAQMSSLANSIHLNGEESLAKAMALKVQATEAALAAAIDAVQVFGGMGYMMDTGVEKTMRDAKYCQLYPVPNIEAGLKLAELEVARRSK